MVSIFSLARSSCKIHGKIINCHRFFTANFHSLSPVTSIPNSTVLWSASKVMASESTDKKVLVTGASGYIAAHVVQQLLEQGYHVRGTVRSLTNQLKVAPLKKLGELADNRLELVEADLLNQECWKDAVKGCTYVIHTASPFPMAMPRDETQVIKPAVEGTLNVLNACVGNVKRVVLTSSVAAVGEYHSPDKKLSEADWTDIERPGVVAYVKSKKLSEKSAWEFLESLDDDAKFEMAVINPAFVLGPVLTQQRGTSIDFLRRIMSGRDPVVPRICFSIADVRDVAKAHIIAMTVPEAAGNRHIIAGERAWFHEISAILKEEFGPQGYSPSTRQMPRMLLTIVSWFDGSLRSIKDLWDVVTPYDTTRMREVLKIEPRPLKDSIIEMAYSLIENGNIPKTRAYKGRPQTNGSS